MCYVVAPLDTLVRPRSRTWRFSKAEQKGIWYSEIILSYQIVPLRIKHVIKVCIFPNGFSLPLNCCRMCRCNESRQNIHRCKSFACYSWTLWTGWRRFGVNPNPHMLHYLVFFFTDYVFTVNYPDREAAVLRYGERLSRHFARDRYIFPFHRWNRVTPHKEVRHDGEMRHTNKCHILWTKTKSL